MTVSHGSRRSPLVGACASLLMFTAGCAHVKPEEMTAQLDKLRTDMRAEYQQGDQNPCIFWNDSCKNSSVQPGSTEVPQQGNISTWDISATFTGSQILPYLNGGDLWLGFDVNQANTVQTLTGFNFYINGVLTDWLAGPTPVPVAQNGTGWADFLLLGFSSFDADDIIRFQFQFAGANDGAENIFLVSGAQNTPVPEPATMVLLGTGLLVAVRARRRKTS